MGLDAGAVDTGNEGLNGGQSANHQVNVNLQAATGHAQRVDDIALIVDDELAWQQVQQLVIGGQVEGARVGITANQVLFGHGSSVLLTR